MEEESKIIVLIFPTLVEASFLEKRLKKVVKPEIVQNEPLVRKYQIKGKNVFILTTGMNRLIENAIPFIQSLKDPEVILTGFARAMNPELKIGEIVDVIKVKKEEEEKWIDLEPKFQNLKQVSDVTCDRVVFECKEKTDIVDMEASYLTEKIKNLKIIKAISDKEEDISFLNKYLEDGKITRLDRLFSLNVIEFQTLGRFFKNAKLAGEKLGEFFFNILTEHS